MNAELIISLFVVVMLIALLVFVISIDVRIVERERHLDRLNDIVDKVSKKKIFLLASRILGLRWEKKLFQNFAP